MSLIELFSTFVPIAFQEMGSSFACVGWHGIHSSLQVGTLFPEQVKAYLLIRLKVTIGTIFP